MKSSASWSVAEMNPGLKDQPPPAYHPSQRRPRDAAVLILLDRTGPTPKVLLGRRHPSLVFMPGYYVCPGGKVEAADARIAAAGALPAHVERRLLREVRNPSPARARGYALAAIRELFEETGLMLGRKAEQPLSFGGEWAGFTQAGILPSLDNLWLVARTITPPGLPRRYDTRFFATDAADIGHTVEGVIHADAELVDLRWVPLDETADLDLHQITRVVLAELVERLRRGLDRDVPVPFIRARNGRMHRYEI